MIEIIGLVFGTLFIITAFIGIDYGIHEDVIKESNIIYRLLGWSFIISSNGGIAILLYSMWEAALTWIK